MALTLLILGPRNGSQLRVTNLGLDDAGTPFVFEQTFRPISIQEHPDVPAIWQRFGLEIRHTGAVDLLVTPIVDSVELPAQQFALTLPGPVGQARVPLSGRFFQFGYKCTCRVQTNTLPSIFSIDGAWFEGAPQPEYRTT
jgi:hypothetical protein